MPVIDTDPHLSNCKHQPKRPEADPKATRPQKQTTNLPERAQSSQDTATNPGRVLPLRRREDLYPHVLDGQPLHLMQEPVAEALRERGAAREHDVGVERFAQVQVRPADSVNDHLVYAWVLEADDLRVEEDLGRAETLWADL